MRRLRLFNATYLVIYMLKRRKRRTYVFLTYKVAFDTVKGRTWAFTSLYQIFFSFKVAFTFFFMLVTFLFDDIEKRYIDRNVRLETGIPNI